VTPARVNDHDGTAKAWAFVTTGAGATVTAGFNVSSVTRNAAGDFTVNFSTPFASRNYAVVGTFRRVSGAGSNGAGFITIDKVNAPTASSCRLLCLDASFALDDGAEFHVAFFGRQ
jgi:hypothetical protein